MSSALIQLKNGSDDLYADTGNQSVAITTASVVSKPSNVTIDSLEGIYNPVTHFVAITFTVTCSSATNTTTSLFRLPYGRGASASQVGVCLRAGANGGAVNIINAPSGTRVDNNGDVYQRYSSSFTSGSFILMYYAK